MHSLHHEETTAWAHFTDYEKRHRLVARVFREPPTGLFWGEDGAAGLETLLRRAADALDMDLVLVGHVNEMTYTTVAFYSRTAEPSITRGDTIPIGETYCRQEISAIEPFLLQDATNDPVHGDAFVEHPGYRVHGLRAYAGAHISLWDGTVFGTLCGVDGSARPVGGEAMEKLSLIAREVAQVLERRLATQGK